jgi:hypothetical protein
MSKSFLDRWHETREEFCEKSDHKQKLINLFHQTKTISRAEDAITLINSPDTLNGVLTIKAMLFSRSEIIPFLQKLSTRKRDRKGGSFI